MQKSVQLIESLWFSVNSLIDYLWECTGIHFCGRIISAPEFYQTKGLKNANVQHM